VTVCGRGGVDVRHPVCQIVPASPSIRLPTGVSVSDESARIDHPVRGSVPPPPPPPAAVPCTVITPALAHGWPATAGPVARRRSAFAFCAGKVTVLVASELAHVPLSLGVAGNVVPSVDRKIDQAPMPADNVLHSLLAALLHMHCHANNIRLTAALADDDIDV
jgi:hypothetical protein